MQAHADYWNEWRGFEVKHGNEDTFREMLRVKRSVQAQYSQARLTACCVVFFMSLIWWRLQVNLTSLNQLAKQQSMVSGGIMGGEAKFTHIGSKRKEPEPTNPLEGNALFMRARVPALCELH